MRLSSSFPGFRIRPTRWGLLYLGVCLVLGMAAVNTGNNALMAILGLALGSYVVSGVWSRHVLGNVEVSVNLPPEIFAGRPVVMEVEISNHSRLLPAYGLTVRGKEGGALVRDPLVPARQRHRHTVEFEFEDRGWQRVGPWRLEVLLPLGFFLKSKELVADLRFLVYPRLLPSWKAPALWGGGRRSEEVFDGRGREGEVTQLRDFREGDEMRQLHWKQTARQQRMVVMDRQRTSEAPVYFVVDPRLDDTSDGVQREYFERMISEVATGVVERVRGGHPVGLVIGPQVIPAVRRRRTAGLLLRPLAEAEPEPRYGPVPASPKRGRVLVFAAKGRE